MFYNLIASASDSVANSSPIVQWVLGRADLILGFMLGLIATLILDWYRTYKRKKRFCTAVCSELKQLLAWTLNDIIHRDAHIDKRKVELWVDSIRKYNLTAEILPSMDDSIKAELDQPLHLNKADIEAFCRRHEDMRKERFEHGNMMTLPQIKCKYISNNMELIGLLNRKLISRFISIIYKIEIRNTLCNDNNVFFSRSYDCSGNNYSRNMHNYYSSCQLLSDRAQVIAKDIISLLEMLT